MAMLTVMGDKLAKKDMTFVFLGPLSECKGCKVKNICFHLERGRKYRILGVREVKHDCEVHEDGVKVVEVEKIPLDAALGKKHAIEGSTITIELPKCRNLGCQHHSLCFPPGVEMGRRTVRGL